MNEAMSMSASTSCYFRGRTDEKIVAGGFRANQLDGNLPIISFGVTITAETINLVKVSLPSRCG